MTTTNSQPLATVSSQEYAALLNNRWFADLPAAQRQHLLEATRRIELRDGQAFASQGHNVRKKRDGFGLVLQGVLKVASSSPTGREAILGYVRPNQWFGELALLDGCGRERDFFASGACELLVVEPDAMQQLMQDPILARHITTLLASRTRALLALVEDFTLRSSLARTARRLVMLAYDDEPQTGKHRTHLEVSQDALASMLGMTRQSVASQLRQLSSRGAIAQSYGRISIASMVALMAEAAAG